MKYLSSHFATLMVTAWVGGLWGIGYLAVPVLFFKQPDRQLAGMLAGQMFTLVGYLGMVCGGYLLIHRLGASRRAALHQPLFWVVAAMLLLGLGIHFGTRPAMAELKAMAYPLEVMQSQFSTRFNILHLVSSYSYHLQSLLGIYLAIKIHRA